MSSKNFPDGLTPAACISVTRWVLARGKFDIIVSYDLVKDLELKPWGETDWQNAHRLWCAPFYFRSLSNSPANQQQRTSPFRLIFPDDETAVSFVLEAL